MCRILRIPPTFTDRSQTNKVRDQTHQCDVDISWYFKVVGNSENSKFEIVWTDFKGRSHGPRLRMLLNRRKKSPTYVPSRRSMRPKLDRLAERVKGVYHALRYHLQKSLGNPISFWTCYHLLRAVPTSRLLVPWGQRPPALQSKSK